jgi:hypothetical protein
MFVIESVDPSMSVLLAEDPLNADRAALAPRRTARPIMRLNAPNNQRIRGRVMYSPFSYPYQGQG